MEPSIGLLIVHGIGNQQPGELTEVVASALAGTEPCQKKYRGFFNRIYRPGSRSSEDQERTDLKKISIDGVPVVIHEANWASLSHPDNPPYIRYKSDLQSEFFGTVCSAWNVAQNSFLGAKTNQSSLGKKSNISWLAIAGISTVLMVALIILNPFGLFVSSLWEEYGSTALGVVLIAVLPYTIINALRRWKRETHNSSLPWWRSLFINLPLAVILGFFRPFSFFLFLLIGAEALLMFSVPVLITYPLRIIGWLLAYPFRGVGILCSHLRLQFVRRWVHKIGWIMIALPFLSIVASVRATGNLFSILFLEKGIITRIMAILGLLAVYIVFLVLILVCEFMIIPITIPFLFPHLDLPTLIFILIFYYPLALLVLNISLPAIDLILDVVNYHVSAYADREDYFEHMDKGVITLRTAGCNEIHVLAHSLGSVIVYDWLHARRPESHPIAVLHTIGSPLDKFWYVDHTQERRFEDHQGLQGLVSRAWVNYWAFFDLVSGELNHYDAPGLHVTNIRMRWLGILILSHARYWQNKKVVETVREWIAKSPAFAIVTL
jgi:hypothetical protein